MLRILAAEDDVELAGYLGRVLEEANYHAVVVGDGTSAFRTAYEQRFDAIILDIMLPSMNGLEITRRLRRIGNTTPILLLTARDASQDVVNGLDAGADDYLTKPFSFEVLLARIRARTRTGAPGVLAFEALRLDSERHEVWRGADLLPLTRTEFALLECLLRAPGRVISRSRLIEAVWGAQADVADNNLDAFIKRLRAKVDGASPDRLIHTVRGVGYTLRRQQMAEEIRRT